MPFDPTRSMQDSGDLSPTTLILNQLRQRGVKPTAANVREAVLANAREGQQAGPDPVGGLRSMAPISSAGDPGVGQGGSVAGKVEGGGRRSSGGGGGRGRNLPVPPVPPGPSTTGPMDRRDNTSSGAPTTSAPPGPDINELITPFAMGAGGAGAAYGLNRYLNGRQGGGEFVGNSPMDPTGRTINVDLPGIEGPNIGGARSQLPTPDIRPSDVAPQLGGPGGPQSGSGGPPPPVSDMENAMQRAIAPGGSGDVDLGGVKPFVNPGDVRNLGLPPGVSDVDAARAAVGPGGFTQDRVAGQVGVPDVNLPARPRVSVQALPALPPSTDTAGLLRSLIEGAGSIARGFRK